MDLKVTEWSDTSAVVPREKLWAFAAEGFFKPPAGASAAQVWTMCRRVGSTRLIPILK
jgi:hypothetical protein